MSILSLLASLAVLSQATQYQDNSYQSIVSRFNQMKEKYPDYIRLYQSYHNDSTPIECGERDCLFFYVELTNFSNPIETIKKLPTVFLVGGFHGDERLGPNIITGKL